MIDYTQIPDYLQPSYQMLKCAFPEGIADDEYWPVLSILHRTMSFRTLAHVLGVLTGKDYIEVLNDASGFGMDPMPDAEAVEKAQQKLVHCGYYEWLKNP